METNHPHQQQAAEHLAGDLSLVPLEQDAFAEKLQRAGFSTIKSARSTERADSVQQQTEQS